MGIAESFSGSSVQEEEEPVKISSDGKHNIQNFLVYKYNQSFQLSGTNFLIGGSDAETVVSDSSRASSRTLIMDERVRSQQTPQNKFNPSQTYGRVDITIKSTVVCKKINEYFQTSTISTTRPKIVKKTKLLVTVSFC